MQNHPSAPELDLLTLYGSRAPSPCDVRPWGFHREGDELELLFEHRTLHVSAVTGPFPSGTPTRAASSSHATS